MTTKNTWLILFAALLSLAACKKDTGSKGSPAGSALIPAATGWQTLAQIPYSGGVSGFEGRNGMTPYDLTVIDDELALVYSEDYVLTGVQGRHFFKVRAKPGTAFPAAVQTTGNSNADFVQFIPGTYNTVYSRIESVAGTYVYHLTTETPGVEAGNNLGYGGYRQVTPVNFYPDGGFTMGGKWNRYNGSDAFYYQYPNSGNFRTTVNQWSLDSTQWLQTSAFQLEGQLYELVISQKDNRLYASVIKDDPDYVGGGPFGDQHDFKLLSRNELPGLNAADYLLDHKFILASTVLQGKYTVLLGRTGAGSGSSGLVIKDVTCCQWSPADGSFTIRYKNIPVAEDLGLSLYNATQIGKRPAAFLSGDLVSATYGAPVKFREDATAYTLYESIPGDGTNRYTALAVINASGTTIAGRYQQNEYPKEYQQFGLGVCQYMNGSYYAVVYQKNDATYPREHANFRLELVRINL